MDPNTPTPAASVSNLVATWDEPDGGGSFEPEAVERVVGRAVEAAVRVESGSRVEHAIRVEQLDPQRAPAPRPRPVTPPEQFDAAARPERRSSYELLDAGDDSWAERHGHGFDEDVPQVDYDLLRRRDIAKELLRARLVGLAEQREHRSAYEIVFIMLAGAVAVLLAAPPLVQVLLAAHGTQV